MWWLSRWKCGGSVSRRCGGSVGRMCGGAVGLEVFWLSWWRCGSSVGRRFGGSVGRRCGGSVGRHKKVQRELRNACFFLFPVLYASKHALYIVLYSMRGKALYSPRVHRSTCIF